MPSPAELRAPARPAGPGEPIDVSVVVCAFTGQRFAALEAALASVDAQRPAALETILVVDHDPALLARARHRFRGVRVLASQGRPGLSGARNTGVAAARGRIVAFLDDDAVAHPGWLRELVAPFGDPAVIGTGGVALPDWESGRPPWMPEEFLWVVGCSYRGLPGEERPIRNPIGATMAFRREVLRAAGGFAEGLGRVGRVPLGCEETELAIRAGALTGGTVRQRPGARVRHRVTSDRARWSYFRRRCWSEGLSKAAVRREVGGGRALASERRYVLRTLPAGILRGLRDTITGDLFGLARSAAIAAGLFITAAGYLWGAARHAREVAR
ncbi:MAG TPA: glycosyltransferase family 2 protein [Solirubrobacteraceae bacterium]|nr:glycosyltransferase family 2 protein [Solirubrobacteraceae bacterium]